MQRPRGHLLGLLAVLALMLVGGVRAEIVDPIVAISQQGSVISWDVLWDFPLEGASLTVVGPEPAPGAERFTDEVEFGASDPITYDATGFTPGTYTWSVELVVAINETIREQQALVREQQLTDPTAGENFVQSLRDQGILPEEGQPTTQFGTFLIKAASGGGGGGGLIVPEDPPDPTQPDDLCPGTPPGEAENAEGCSVSQLCPCDGPKDGGEWAGPFEYRACVTAAADEFVAEGVIDASTRDTIVAEANASECGDKCPGTPPGEAEDPQGCSISQLCPCDGKDGVPWKNHGEYVSCVAHTADSFVTRDLITEQEKGGIVSAAARSSCGKPGKGKGPK